MINQNSADFSRDVSMEQMDAQAMHDDQDLGQLKRRLTEMANKPMPASKEGVIQSVSERLDIAEKALEECENIIDKERDNRKLMSQ
jgi:hypothetical protein